LNSKKGQISTELLVLIGLILALMLPVLLYAYGRANVTQDDIAVQKAEFAAQRLARLADSVGYLGGGAAIVDEIEIPPGFRSLYVNGERDIVVGLSTASGNKQIVKSSDFNLTSSGLDKITQAGTYFIEVRSASDYARKTNSVQICFGSCPNTKPQQEIT
jgi:type II secretory pathway pseudopilin PulG